MSQLSAEIKDIYWYDNLGLVNIAQVGGKNASLGKMISNMAEEGGGTSTATRFNRLFFISAAS